MLKNYYQILGVNYDASKDEIKKAYRVYVSKIHPDKHKDDTFFNNLFLEVQEAYNVLYDDEMRSRYDQTLLKDSTNNTSLEEPQARLLVSKRKIKFGDTVTFVWETQNVDNIEIVGHGHYESEGSIELTPTKTTEYTFLFSNKENILKKQITIEVKKNYSVEAIIGIGIGILLYIIKILFFE